MTNMNDIRASIMNDAATLNDESLCRTLSDTDETWEVLKTIANDDNFYPTTLRVNKSGHQRTDVSTMKANIARRNQLKGWIANESEAFANDLFKEIYLAELDALDAYAMHAVLKLYDADATILNHVANVKKELRDAAKARMAEAASKRRATLEEKKKEGEKARKAHETLMALVAEGKVDESYLDMLDAA